MGHTVKGIESRYVTNSLARVDEELKMVEEIKKNRVIHLSYIEEKEEVTVPTKIAETQAV